MNILNSIKFKITLRELFINLLESEYRFLLDILFETSNIWELELIRFLFMAKNSCFLRILKM
jgi:hypothetical protein